MPGRVLQTVAAGLVLTISLPVLALATFTSIAALILVGVRASVLSSEFWISVLVESWTHQQKRAAAGTTAATAAAAPPTPLPVLPKKQPPTIEFRPPSRSRTNSFADSKRHSWRSEHGSSAATPTHRSDFEGVGGWRTASELDDQNLWTNMASRLDRTRSSGHYHHRRSLTGGSQHSTALNSPELLPLPIRTPGARYGSTSGSSSPQSYFALPTSRSMVSLHVKRPSAHHKWDLTRGQSMSLDLDRDAEQIGVAI